MVVHDDMGSPRQHRAAPGRHAVMHEAISTGGARHMQHWAWVPTLKPVSSRCLTGAWRIFSHTAVAKFRARSAVLAIIWPIVPAETRTPNRSARICPSRSSGRNCRRRDRSPRPPAGCHIAPVPGPRAERRPWSSSAMSTLAAIPLMLRHDQRGGFRKIEHLAALDKVARRIRQSRLTARTHGRPMHERMVDPLRSLQMLALSPGWPPDFFSPFSEGSRSGAARATVHRSTEAGYCWNCPAQAVAPTRLHEP